jgi:polysaccharide biosynthesis/export protein
MTFALSLVLAATLTQAPAQTPTPPPSPTPAPIRIPGLNAPAPPPGQAKPDAPPPGYLIGPQDKLRITVYGEEGLTNTYPVDSDGSITFPMLNRVAAGGLSVGEFQDRLRAKLADGYIHNPQVQVEVAEFKSQKVMVAGEVRNPGAVQMHGQMTLVEALAAAGSTMSSAGNDITISRQKRNAAGAVPSANDVDIIHVNLKDVLIGKAGRDFLMQDQDYIFVPKAQIITMTGEVRTIGTLIWEEGLTVEEAIARAGGMTDKGTHRGITAKRLIDGTVKEVELKLSDKVRPDDIIKIPRRFF